MADTKASRTPKTATLLLAENAPAPARFAASELTAHLLDLGVAVLPSGGALTFRLDSACPPGFTEGLPDEGFRYRVSGGTIDIAGTGPRGTVYGVYAFLEEALGFRWYTSTVRRVPAWAGPPPDVDVRRAPAFAYREVYWRDATDGDFALKLRLNSSRARILDEHGGRVRFHRFSHTFDELVPAAKYFDSHPEYFSLVDGERLRERTQLCLTNPDVLRIATEGVRAWMRDNPDCTIFSVAQNDWYNNCTCPACAALDNREGSAAGSMIHFVNAIADAIADEFPHALLHTFAYIYTRKAPRFVRPRKNVIVRLCSIECCFSHPLDACAHSVDTIDVQEGRASGAFRPHDASLFLRDLKDWSAIADRLYIWDYTVNFANYPQPFPNLGVLQANLRLFREYGVQGVFEQGNFSPGAATALAGLKVYLLAKLLWDPDADADALTRDFLAGVFGSAAPHMRRYIDLMEGAARAHHAGIYDMPDAPYFTDALLDEANACLLDGETAAGDEETRARVALERLAVRYTKLARLPLDAPDRAAQWDALAADFKRHGVTEVFERKEFDASIACLKESPYGYDREDVPYVDYRM